MTSPATSRPPTRPRVVMAESSDIFHDYRVQKEAATLAEAGYDVRVYGFRPAGPEPERTAFPFCLRTWPVASRRRRALRNLTMAANIGLINLLCVATRASFYHAHNTMFLVGMWLGSRLHRGRLVYDAHEVQWEAGRLAGALEWVFIRRADGVINVARGRAAASARRYGVAEERFTIVSNYPLVDESHEWPEPPLAPGGVVRLIFSGGYNLENNRLDLLVRALCDVPAVELDIMGFGYEGSEERLRRLVTEFALTDRVRFLPLVRPDQVMSSIASYDAAVNLLVNPRAMIAIRFASVNKMYEYLAAGLPILCSRIESFEEEFVREGAAVSVGCDSAEEVSEGLRRLISDRAQLRVMRQRALELARNRYNWRTQGAELVGLYRKLARTRGAGRA